MNAQHRRLIGLVNARSRSVLTAALFLLCWEAVALAGPHGIGTGDKNEKFQHDRKAILAMAGNYHVSFNFRETVSFVEGYTLKAPYEPDGYEIVRVIRDDGGLISLQHILVAGGIWGDQVPIKHWRQDWRYEPEHIFEYAGRNVWRTRQLDEAERRGKWRSLSSRSMIARAMSRSPSGHTSTESPPGPHRRHGGPFPGAKRASAMTMMCWCP